MTTPGLSTRASAISAAGTVLSQPTTQTSASKSCACAISSIESAITSREISDARIPGVPCDWLSETAIVLNGSGTPPASRAPFATCCASSSWLTLHGIVPVHVDTTPTIGSSSRAGSIPSARKCARAPARSAACASPSRARRRRASGTWRVYAALSSRAVHVRFGLLSTAAINAAVLGARAEDAPFELVAVASRSLSRAEAYAHEHGIARAFGSYDALLADDGIDAVYIALPNALHHEWTIRALAAGKHVLVEKPYSRFPAQVDEAWDEAERRGLVLEEAYMWRHSAQTRLLLELLLQVGEIRSLHATFTANLKREDDPRWVAELGGGALLDVGCYCVSAARLLLGEPDAVHGEARMRGEVDIGFAGTLRFGEVATTFQCALDSPL